MQPALPDIFISAHASLAASNTPECLSDTPQSPPAAQAWPSPSDSPPSPAWPVPSTRAHNNLIGCSYFFFWLCHVVFRIPVPQPGIKPGPPAVEAQCPNSWTTREFPESMLLEGRDLVLFVFPGCIRETFTKWAVGDKATLHSTEPGMCRQDMSHPWRKAHGTQDQLTPTSCSEWRADRDVMYNMTNTINTAARLCMEALKESKS